jgi:ribosomal protein S27E
MSDLISRQAAISAICNACGKIDCDKMDKCEKLQLPPANNSEIPNSSDTISRQQAIDICRAPHMRNADCSDFEMAIMMLPPAQPERIKGHWIEMALSNHTYKCSVCGRILVNITDGKNNVAKNYPYCHCGADMRGEQNERDS